MTTAEFIAEKEDYKDVGPMGDYDDPLKPECEYHGKTWVLSVGRDGKWHWKCTNCQKIWEPTT